MCSVRLSVKIWNVQQQQQLLILTERNLIFLFRQQRELVLHGIYFCVYFFLWYKFIHIFFPCVRWHMMTCHQGRTWLCQWGGAWCISEGLNCLQADEVIWLYLCVMWCVCLLQCFIQVSQIWFFCASNLKNIYFFNAINTSMSFFSPSNIGKSHKTQMVLIKPIHWVINMIWNLRE